MFKSRMIIPIQVLICLGVMVAPLRVEAVEPPPNAALGARVAYVAHLLDGGRYDEAINAQQALMESNPNAPEGYQLRGSLFLMFGSLQRAEHDFRIADSKSPDNSTTLYSLALCALFRRQFASAQSLLARAKAVAADSLDELQGINAALAYVYFLRGQTAAARNLLPADSPVPDSFTDELQAFIAARAQPKETAKVMRRLLETSSGVPRVREEEGLRALFSGTSHAIEPSVLEPARRQFYLRRMMDRYTAGERIAAKIRSVKGPVTLTPKFATGNSSGYVSFNIDGRMAATMNSRPFAYEWNTQQESNGRHVIRIDATDDSGRVTASETFSLNVRNKVPGKTAGDGLTVAERQEVRRTLLNLLRLHPAWKVAETTLAHALSLSGDRDSASFHIAVAAALDPEYANGRAAVRSVLRHSAPLNPPATKKQTMGWWQGPAENGKMVALTFDDGPNRGKTEPLLDALDRAGIPATFFVVGSRAAIAPDLVQRMHRRGDEVENHSYTHPNMAQSLPDVAEGEILRGSVIIRALTGRYPRFFRPPGGNENHSLAPLAQNYGMALAFWTIDALGMEESASPQAVTNWILAHLKPGSIVLLHNGADATTRALPSLVAGLHVRGYKIVTLGRLVESRKVASAHKRVAKR